MADMIVDEIRQKLHNGFQPFTLRLSNGRSFRIPHRDFIALASKVVVVIDENEVSHSISPLHIVSIEDSVAHG